MKKRDIIFLTVAFIASFGVFAKAEAIADATGLVPIISWDFDSQPNSDELTTANKGSVAVAFNNEGTYSYVEESIGKYAINTSIFTPYFSSEISVPATTGLSLSMFMTLGTSSNGVSLSFRTGAGDVVIRRGTTEGSLLVGFGPQSSASTQYLEVNLPNGDTEYYLINLIVEETGMSLYINGLLSASTTSFTAWNSGKLISAMQFGSHYGGNKGDEKKGGGYIGDLRVYDNVLSENQIELLAQEFEVSSNLYFAKVSNQNVYDNTFSAEYSLIVPEGTADVSVVYDVDPDFSNPTINEIAANVSTGENQLSISNLEFGTTYYYQLIANTGSEQSESSVYSFSTESVINTTHYTKRLEVKIPGYTGTTELKNFPVLIKLSEEKIPNFYYSNCNADGSDIVCTKTNNVIVPHEIELWDINGTSYIWVKVPRLSGTETTLYLYYNIISQDKLIEGQPEEVWSEYATVFHGGETIVDSTGQAVDIQTAGVTSSTTNGIVAGVMTKASSETTGVQFSNPVKSGALLTISKFSASGWFKKQSSSTGIIVANKNSWEAYGFLALLEAGTYFSVSVNAKHQGTAGQGGLTVNEWGYVAFSYDNNTLKSYHNGAQIYENSSAVTVTDTGDQYWAFGSYNSNDSNSFVGEMDELRVYNGVASSDWIKAEYDTIINNSSFVEFVEVVNLNPGVTVLNTPSVSKNGDGTFTISVEILENAPTYVNCIVGDTTFEMTTEATTLPMVYTTIVSDIDIGTYTAKIVATTDGSSVDRLTSAFYYGALEVEVISDADEGTMTSGCFRVSRKETETLSKISFDCIFSGAGVLGTSLPESMTVTIPEGVSYVDIPVQPKYSAEVDQDAEVVITISGDMIALTSSNVMTIKNAIGDVFVRYVNPAGSDENDGLTEETPFKTISYAVDALSRYDQDGSISTIYLSEGLYPISSPIYLTNSIHVIGMGVTPSDVVVSNTIGESWDNQNQRIFYVDNTDAFITGLTMQRGGGHYGNHGGNIFIGKNGGVVSNCVIEAGRSSLNTYAAGARVEGGLITHTIFRDNRCGSGSGSWQGSFRGGALEISNSGIVENCLLEENNQSVDVALVHLYDTSIMRNCTIVNSSLSSTNEYCDVFTALRIDSKATAQNIVIAGVTNTIDGAACLPSGTVANFINGAVDGDITGLGFNEKTVVGTAEEFFTNYAIGNYRPKTGGVLTDSGLNYEGMAKYDLTGKQDRLIGSFVDIGCYEGEFAGTIVLVK